MGTNSFGKKSAVVRCRAARGHNHSILVVLHKRMAGGSTEVDVDALGADEGLDLVEVAEGRLSDTGTAGGLGHEHVDRATLGICVMIGSALDGQYLGVVAIGVHVGAAGGCGLGDSSTTTVLVATRVAPIIRSIVDCDLRNDTALAGHDTIFFAP